MNYGFEMVRRIVLTVWFHGLRFHISWNPIRNVKGLVGNKRNISTLETLTIRVEFSLVKLSGIALQRWRIPNRIRGKQTWRERRQVISYLSRGEWGMQI